MNDEEILNFIRSLKEHLLTQAIDSNNQKVVQAELYGYKDSIPDYRVLYSYITAEFKYKSGKEIKNEVLPLPINAKDILTYQKMNETYIYTGVADLHELIESSLETPLSAVEIEMINQLYGGLLVVTNAKYILSQESIYLMLEAIASNFE